MFCFVKYENELKWGKSSCFKQSFNRRKKYFRVFGHFRWKVLKGHIFLGTPFQYLVCFILFAFLLHLFIGGNQFQLYTERKSVNPKVNYFGIVIMLPG